MNQSNNKFSIFPPGARVRVVLRSSQIHTQDSKIRSLSTEHIGVVDSFQWSAKAQCPFYDVLILNVESGKVMVATISVPATLVEAVDAEKTP